MSPRDVDRLGATGIECRVWVFGAQREPIRSLMQSQPFVSCVGILGRARGDEAEDELMTDVMVRSLQVVVGRDLKWVVKGAVVVERAI